MKNLRMTYFLYFHNENYVDPLCNSVICTDFFFIKEINLQPSDLSQLQHFPQK